MTVTLRDSASPKEPQPPTGLRLAVCSQTPLVRFKRDVPAPEEGTALDLQALTRGEDWSFTAGGVTRMLKPLLESWSTSGFASRLEWVALQSQETPPVAFKGFRASFVNLTKEERAGYVQVKEALWALLNGLPNAPDAPDALPESAWNGFHAYAERTAQHVQDVEPRVPFNAAYVHDFQLLELGRAFRDDRRAVFHLHTPFARNVPRAWGQYFADTLSHYDAVIVSSRAYAEAVKAAGHEGPLHVVYPFVDPKEYPRATREDVAAFRAQYGVSEDDRVILNVARMDPMKSQDRLVDALPLILEEEPRARLVLVGNGSFSSSKNGGLGLSKGARWRKHLEELARDLGVADRVTFTGHLRQREMPAAYACADAFALPSVREGFGLAVVEAWLYDVPAIVSEGAGVKELVRDGENGFVVASDDAKDVTRAVTEVLNLTPDKRAAFADAGREAAKEATLPVGRARLEAILKDVARAIEGRHS